MVSYPTNFIFGPSDACVGYYSGVLYVAFSVLGLFLFIFQVVFLQQLVLLPIYLLPLLTFCITYENAVMYYSCNAGGIVDPMTVGAGYVFNALIPPLFIIVLYESVFRLHEARQAHFFCLPMEQGDDFSSAPGLGLMWFVRLVATGLFIMGIFVNFSLVNHDDAPHAGSGGYAYLADHKTSLAVWLSLIPPIVLSFMTLVACLSVHRYGKYNAMGLVNRWKYFWPAAAVLITGYCFSDTVYPVTSNAGEMALLLGLTALVSLIQQDLGIAASFADFLHQSNQAFQPLPAAVIERLARRVEDELLNSNSNSNSNVEESIEMLIMDASETLDKTVKEDMRLQRHGAPSFSVDLESPSLISVKV